MEYMAPSILFIVFATLLIRLKCMHIGREILL